MSLTRSLLAKAFPDNPRLVSELEALDDLLSQTNANGQTAADQIGTILDQLGDGNAFQPASSILAAIAAVPNRVGAVEILNDGSAAIRPIDGQDPASLLSRGASYTVLVGIGGKGPTTSRPSLPENAVGLYFDTTLAAAGKPIFWTGIGWVDSTGASV